jgi:hypothetical protein
MGKTILYGKIGRSMPLTLDKCGVVGGDQEMTAVISLLAQRHPEDTFILMGRNSGEDPRSVGLPPNIFNPWTTLASKMREFVRHLPKHGGMSVDHHVDYAKMLDHYILPHFRVADAVIMWAGQHGTSNSPLPQVKDRSLLTKPQDAFAHYAGFLLRGINYWRDVNPWRREEVWLNADPRNYLKMRDLKWPLRHPILAQYDYVNNIKHERYGDSSGWDEWSSDGGAVGLTAPDDRDKVWQSIVRNVYSRLELNLTVPGSPSGDLMRFQGDYRDRGHFGIVINEARANGIKTSMTRLTAMKDWVMPLQPEFIFGTWSYESQDALGVDIDPIDWRRYIRMLETILSTFTTPSSGSGWATTKPWEAFATGTVCFFHPRYDDQNHILKDAPKELQDWLRVDSPVVLRERVKFMATTPAGRAHWERMVKLQRAHYEQAVANPLYIRMIEQRIYGGEL